MKAALVTARGADDEDLVPLARACAAVRLEAVICEWDDPAVEWQTFDLVVVRSTWDYALRRDEFLRWAEEVADLTALHNPVPVLEWNTDKHYLGEAAEHVTVVPTEFVEPGGGYTLPNSEFVVKPAISAGSKDTTRYAAGDFHSAHSQIESLIDAGRSVMIQPYQPAVDSVGERALIFIDAQFSHAATKGPLLQAGQVAAQDHELFAVEEMSEASPSVAELALANQVMDWITDRFGALLYARVDLIDDDGGSPQLLELELAEPSLFHDYAPGSADRFARAIARRLE